jgi:hypothetical protein
MPGTLLSDIELAEIRGGEPLSMTAIMTVLIIAVVVVIVYKLFISSSGSTTLPGGFKFEWK